MLGYLLAGFIIFLLCGIAVLSAVIIAYAGLKKPKRGDRNGQAPK